MNNPTCLKPCIDKEEAEWLIDYLYCEKIAKKVVDSDTVVWYDYFGNKVAKWTKEYRNLMVSEGILIGGRR